MDAAVEIGKKGVFGVPKEGPKDMICGTLGPFTVCEPTKELAQVKLGQLVAKKANPILWKLLDESHR